MHDIKGAVENLPDLTPRESTRVGPLAMTETDTVVTLISERLSHHFPTAGDISGQGLADAGGMIDSCFESAMGRKPLELTGLDRASRDMSSTGGIAPCRTRTYNPLIKRQLPFRRNGLADKEVTTINVLLGSILGGI